MNEDFSTNENYYKKVGIITFGIFFLIFGLWAFLAPLSSSIVATGKVIVASKNKEIKHLEGGIVKSILVKDGDIVKTNQKLVELDETQLKVQLDMLLSQYYEEIGIESRLLSERDGFSEVFFNKEIFNSSESSKIVETQKREFNARKNQLKEEEKIYLERIEQLKNKINSAKNNMLVKKELSISYSSEIKELDELYKENIIDKVKLTETKREKLKIDGDISTLKSDINNYYSQIEENKALIENQKKTFLKEVVSNLQESQLKITNLNLKIKGIKDNLNKLSIISPANGIVSNLQVFTIGGVIGSGSKIMEIVPEGDSLVVEGKVSATDANNVYKGLSSEIRFPSFSHNKSLDYIEGEVIFVAADAVLDEKTQSLYYPIKVSITKKGKEELVKNKLVIQPGMPVEIMIVVKEHTLIEYLIDPVKNISRKAFNEL